MKTTKLEKIDACRDAREWVATQENYKEAWQNCERGDWMLWLARRLNIDDRKLTFAKFKCANQVRHLMKDQRSLDALDAAEKFGNGEISKDELAAAAAAAAAADANANVAATYAAYAANGVACKNSLKISAGFCREILTDEVLTAYRKLQ